MGHSKIKAYFFSQKDAADNVAVPWLLALRWGEIVCQILLLFAVVLLMEIPVPWFPVVFIFLFESVSNLYLHFRQKNNEIISNQMIFIILLLDTVFLTLLLYVTGGVMNPFVFLYLLHIVLGAIILSEICSWLITIATLLCYGLLFYFPPPVVTDLSGASQLSDLAGCHLIDGIPGSFQIHLQGMWVAFVITSCFIVFFVSKIQKALTVHRTTLQSLAKEEARNEKLSSLTTLAAGAAHELSTPLGTVAIISNEMIHTLKEQECSTELLEDARLIRKQITDCKEILYQMSAGAGEHLGEGIERYPVQEIISRILKGLPSEQRQRIQLDIDGRIGSIRIPLRSLCRTIKGLLLNGFEASGESAEVNMEWFIDMDMLRIRVMDHGTGIDKKNIELAVTPFFTTKESGLGLGLFLAKTLADQLHGHLEIVSELGQGSTVTMTLPLALLAHKP
jgi:two-component system, sensor histidine kinase RegB